jgi:Tfp pilus assembly protein PilX
MKARNKRLWRARKYDGAVLITGLILLVAMTIIGVTAMQTTVLEERMAGNLRDYSVAFQAAEAGLQAGISYLDPGFDPGFDRVLGKRPKSYAKFPDGDKVLSACKVGTGKGQPSACDLPEILANWTDLSADPTEGKASGDLTGADADARYGDSARQPLVVITSNDQWPSPTRCRVDGIEETGGSGKNVENAGQDCSYTVTALGFGIKGRTRVVLQTTVRNWYKPRI